MATRNNIYRSYSMEYGTFVGLGWGALFLCYVGGIVMNNAILMLLCVAVGLACLLLPFWFAMRLNKMLHGVGEKLSYLQGLLFSVSMFMYACLMSGLVAFAYFRFMDSGALYEALHSMITQPEMVATYKQMGLGEAYSQMQTTLSEMQSMSAFDKALLLFNNNFCFSIIMSFLVAIAASCSLKNGGNINKEA
ncbi:MAG: DUF4199 domain-containing protein [Prevotellaceae bacterium]|nr:DUF4199 domain-containing protein [Prevotellaceae bacterium]